MPDFESILADASQLPVTDRVQLIEALWETVPEHALPPLSSEWLAEIARRSLAFDAGTREAIPWAQVKEDADRRLADGNQ